MGIEANKATANAIAQGVATAQVDRTLFTDDAVWWMLGRGELPIDAFVEMNRAIAKNLLAGPGQMTVHGMTAEGDRVAVEAEIVVELQNGRTYHNLYHFLMLFRGGKATLVKEYYDTAVARETLGTIPKGDQ